MASSAPLVWRLRHRLGAIAFGLAVVFVAAGAWVVVASLLEGDVAATGVGLTLIVGGLLVMVGRRMRARK